MPLRSVPTLRSFLWVAKNSTQEPSALAVSKHHPKSFLPILLPWIYQGKGIQGRCKAFRASVEAHGGLACPRGWRLGRQLSIFSLLSHSSRAKPRQHTFPFPSGSLYHSHPDTRLLPRHQGTKEKFPVSVVGEKRVFLEILGQCEWYQWAEE